MNLNVLSSYSLAIKAGCFFKCHQITYHAYNTELQETDKQYMWTRQIALGITEGRTTHYGGQIQHTTIKTKEKPKKYFGAM